MFSHTFLLFAICFHGFPRVFPGFFCVKSSAPGERACRDVQAPALAPREATDAEAAGETTPHELRFLLGPFFHVGLGGPSWENLWEKYGKIMVEW